MLTKAEIVVQLLEQFEDDAGAETMESLDLPLSPKAHKFLRCCGKWRIYTVFQSAFVIPRPARSQPGLARCFGHAASPTFGAP
jgi:hypothetical protein